MLYHYTRAKNLMSMLSSRELWLTDFRALGDEPLFAQRLVQRTLTAVEHCARTRDLLAQLPAGARDGFAHAWRQLRGRFSQLDGGHRQAAIPFVFCLTSDHDCAALWRRHDVEICVEFDRSGLLRATGMTPVQVRYRAETDIDDKLATALEQALADSLGQAKSDSDAGLPPTFSSNSLLRAAHDVFQLAAIKNAAHRQEAEWRLIRHVRLGYDSGTFLSAEPVLESRAAVRLAASVPLGDIVTGLRFGPGFDRKLAMHVISTLRRAYHLDLFPEFSHQSLRTSHAA